MLAAAARYRTMFEVAEIPLPDGEAKKAPNVFVGMPKGRRPTVQRLSSELSSLLCTRGLWRRDKEIGTIDPITGEWEVMTPHTLVTWIPKVAGIVLVGAHEKTTGKIEEGELGVDQARQILADRELRARLPEITKINKVRLPVMREELDERDGHPMRVGYRKMELLAPGHDQSTGIYTCAGGMQYAEDMEIEEAIDYLYDLFRFFGWRCARRDWAIHLASMLSMYARGCYVGKAPMVVYNANIQESGKTTLASYVSWLVHGTKGTKPLMPDAEDELEKVLNSAVLAASPYLIFDNVDWKGQQVRSVLLDEFLSNSEKEVRVMGGNQLALRKLSAVTMMTGNGVTLSTDLARRSLIVDLLNKLSGADRVLPADATLIDEPFFTDEGNRAKGLAALWSMMRYWDDVHRPMRPGKLLGSFEDWSRLVPSVVMCIGKAKGEVWDCREESKNEDIGNKDDREAKRLAMLAIDELCLDSDGKAMDYAEVTVQQFAGLARRHAVYTYGLWPHVDIQSVLDTKGEKGGFKLVDQGIDAGPVNEEEEEQRQASQWLVAKTRASFGKALYLRFNEKQYAGSGGTLYEFTHRKSVTPARYNVVRVR